MIDPSVRTVLQSRYAIREFFSIYSALLIGIILLLIVITEHGVGNKIAEALSNFLGNFAATVAIFIITYGFFIYVTPVELRNAVLIPLGDGEIAKEILNLQQKVSDYWFWGRSGSYFRSIVLKELDASSLKDRRHIKIRIVLPDPDIEANRLHYMKIKRSLNEPADKDTLSAHVLATIWSAVMLDIRNPFLNVDIALSRSVPVIRYDVSSVGGLMTRDARNLPAILVNSANPIFEMFKDAVENELSQGRNIDWDESDFPDLAHVGVISDVHLARIQNVPRFSPQVVESANEILQKQEHRYAR